MEFTIKDVLEVSRTALLGYRLYDLIGRKTNYAEFVERHNDVVKAIAQENGIEPKDVERLPTTTPLGGGI